MSFDALLNRTCSIQERLAGVAGRDGKPTYTWPVKVAGVRCRVDDIEQADAIRLIALSTDKTLPDKLIFMREPAGITGVLNEVDHRIVTDDGVVYRSLRVQRLDEFGDPHHLEIEALTVTEREA